MNVATQYRPVSFSAGDKVYHQKYGEGTGSAVVANKLTVDFDRCDAAKRVIDAYVKLCAKSAEIIPFPANGRCVVRSEA